MEIDRRKKMSELGITQNERLLKAVDVARILNISKAMAYRLIQQREIPVVRISHAVRVRLPDLETYIKRCSETSISG
jgi:excisionase family DNA binding protein